MAKPGPKPRNQGARVLQIRLNDRDYASLEAVADDERMAVAAWARGVLLRYVQVASMTTSSGPFMRDGESIMRISIGNPNKRARPRGSRAKKSGRS